MLLGYVPQFVPFLPISPGQKWRQTVLEIKSFMQPTRRLIMHSWGVQFFSLWGGGRGEEFFFGWNFSLFSWGSQMVPQVPNLFPKMFFKVSQIYPIWFCQSSTPMYINWKDIRTYLLLGNCRFPWSQPYGGTLGGPVLSLRKKLMEEDFWASGSGIVPVEIAKKILVNVRFSAGMAVMLLVGGAWQLTAAYWRRLFSWFSSSFLCWETFAFLLFVFALWRCLYRDNLVCVSYTRSFDYQTQTEDKAGSHAECCLY